MILLLMHSPLLQVNVEYDFYVGTFFLVSDSQYLTDDTIFIYNDILHEDDARDDSKSMNRSF